ncbi:MAG TPA: ATP-binding protein [Candidatus Sumerlaeota bacterium]|nr:ATP-binding protein [Candidatus Sumerlaeota bacterium]
MKAADLDILIQDGEGAMLEYNEDISSSLAREMVAFANTAGSHILLGLNDNGMVKGIVDNNAIVNPFPAVEEVVPQAPRKYPASTPQVLAILIAAATEDKTRDELQEAAEIKDREHFRKQYLEPVLESGLIERTIPDKPRSPRQRYRTTQAGREFLNMNKKERTS